MRGGQLPPAGAPLATALLLIADNGVYRRRKRRCENNVEASPRAQSLHHHHQEIFTVSSEVYDEIVDLDSKDLNAVESYDHPYDVPRSASPNPYQGLYEATAADRTNAAVPNGADPTVNNDIVSKDYQRLKVGTTKNQSSHNNSLARRRSSCWWSEPGLLDAKQG